MNTLHLGTIIEPTREAFSDACHMAITPLIAGENILPGEHLGLNAKGEGTTEAVAVGIADPFLRHHILKGERFWLFLYPGSITSLRHCWTHPAFAQKQGKDAPEAAAPLSTPKSASEQWMRKWAMAHMGYDYYSERELPSSEGEVYDRAIDAGHNMSVGPYENARHHINNEWWTHWENITGSKGDRDSHFSCGC